MKNFARVSVSKQNLGDGKNLFVIFSIILRFWRTWLIYSCLKITATSSPSTTKDCLSKYIVMRPLKTKTLAEVAHCLMSIFFEHGPTSILHTDNGAKFSNKPLMSRIKALARHTHRSRQYTPFAESGKCGAS